MNSKEIKEINKYKTQLNNLFKDFVRLQMRTQSLMQEMEKTLGHAENTSPRKRRNLKEGRLINFEKFYKEKGIL